METHSKTAFFRKAAAVAGMSAAVLVGSLFPEQGMSMTGTNAADLGNKRPAAVAIGRSDNVEFVEYRKAGLDEYQMPVAVTSVKTENPAAETDKTASDKADKAAQSVGNFSVAIPADSSQAMNVTPDKLNLTNTRSTVNEFYTVNDIRTGKKVTLNAHELVCSMVYSEIGASWNEEAIKAQAVAAYTHLRFNDAIGHIPTVGMIRNYPAKIEKCVSAVEGQCVMYNGSIINAVYCASSAGCTADSYSVFGVSYPYLKPVVSAFDSKDPNYGTVTRLTATQVRSKLEGKLGFKLSDDLTNWFTVSAVHGGKYVKTLVIDGGKAKMSGEAARWLFGLKSSAFEITYSNGMFSFKTYGYGHGVGMSQWGAKLYADKGYTYDQILRHYYVNTQVSVSQTSIKALKRGNMSTAELEKEIKESTVAKADKAGSNPADDIVVDQQAIQKAEADKAAAEADKAAADKAAAEKAEADKAVADKSAEQETADKSGSADQPTVADVTSEDNTQQPADAAGEDKTQGE